MPTHRKLAASTAILVAAMPLVAAAGLGSGIVAALAAVFRPGYELVVGGSFFLLALGGMALANRFKSESAVCGSGCKVDASCCARGAATRRA